MGEASEAKVPMRWSSAGLWCGHMSLAESMAGGMKASKHIRSSRKGCFPGLIASPGPWRACMHCSLQAGLMTACFTARDKGLNALGLQHSCTIWIRSYGIQ